MVGVRPLLAILIFVVAVSPSAHSAVVGGCIPNDFAKFAGAGHSLAAAKADFPSVANFPALKSEFESRRALRAISHPADPDNFAMPEQKNGIDWLKKQLLEMSKDPDFKFRDAQHLRYGLKARETERLKLIGELNAIEKENYPYKKTIAAADRVVHFFDRIDHVVHVDTAEGENFLHYLKEKKGITIDDTSRLRLGRLRAKWADSIGDQHIQDRIAFESDLIATVAETAKEQGRAVDARSILREYEATLSLQQPEAQNMTNLGDNMGNRFLPDQIYILAPGEGSFRGLAEAGLFSANPGGVIVKPRDIDGIPVNGSNYLKHDSIHIGQIKDDIISQALQNKSNSEKMQLLATIDAIQNPRHKELAEHALAFALREIAGSSQYTRTSREMNSRIGFLNRSYERVVGHPLSHEDAKWMLEWWDQHLPVRPD